MVGEMQIDTNVNINAGPGKVGCIIDPACSYMVDDNCQIHDPLCGGNACLLTHSDYFEH